MEREKLIRIVTAAQNGDTEAMNTLFNTFYNDVYYFALKTVKDEDLACDITQETFVEVLNTLGNLEEPVAFVTWMKKITYHQCTRYFKKKKDVLVDEDEEGNTVFDTLAEDRTEFIPEEALDQADFRKTIMNMIDQLSDEQRAAVLLFYFEELSVKQIAQMQNVSEGTVKSRLNYARKAIKSEVEAYEKKHDIKLHSFGFLPLLLWLFRDQFAETMPVASAKTVAAGITAATGTTVSLGSAAAVTAGTTATAAAVGLGAKLASIPLMAKITAGLVAATIVVGGGAVVTQIVPPSDTQPSLPVIATEPAQIEQTQPTQTEPTETEVTEPTETAQTEPTETEPTETEPTETEVTAPTETEATEHIHSYISQVTQQAGCTTEGMQTFACDCGDTYDQVIAATGHSWSDWLADPDATDKKTGTAYRNCSACGESETQTIPIKSTAAATVDTSINLTGTTYEALVRQYTQDHTHNSFDETQQYYLFSIPDAGDMNILGLKNCTAKIRVSLVSEEQGKLSLSTLEGESPHAALSPEQILRNTIADATAAFQTQPSDFVVVERSTNSSVLGQYSSYEQIPDEYLQMVMDGSCELRIYYDMPSNTTFRVGVSIRQISSQSQRWNVYFTASYR